MQNETTIIVEILKWGIGGAVLVTIFWKFIPTLFEFLKDKQSTRSPMDEVMLIATLEKRVALNEQRIYELNRAIMEYLGARTPERKYPS